jgi:anti-sigma factor RsiW
MRGEREVGGLRCSVVLTKLSDYLDGELSQAEREALEAHVRGCDVCARFGGRFSEAVRMLRVTLGATEGLPEDVESRLDAALDAGLDGE